MRNINPFVIKTLIFCMMLFALTTTAHSLALMVKDSTSPINTNDYNYTTGTTGRQDNSSDAKGWDISPLASGVGAILLGMDMPMPMPIIVTLWNVILLTIITYDVTEIIKAWIPLL